MKKLPGLDQGNLSDNFAAARARLNGVLKRLLKIGRFDEYRSVFFDMVTKRVVIIMRRNQLFGRIYVLPNHDVVRDKNRQPILPRPIWNSMLLISRREKMIAIMVPLHQVVIESDWRI